MNHAILLTFQLEQIPIDGELIDPEPIVTFFESPHGRALLKELIRGVREGGQMWTPGAGSTFFFTLPRRVTACSRRGTILYAGGRGCAKVVTVVVHEGELRTHSGR